MARPSICYRPERSPGLTREAVIWAYRLFLDREPESEAVIEEKMGRCPSAAALRRELLEADEYHRRNPPPSLPAPGAGEPTRKIDEESPGANLSRLSDIFEFLYERHPMPEEAAILADIQRLGLTRPVACFRHVISRFDRQSFPTPFSMRFSGSDIDYVQINDTQIAVDTADVSTGGPLYWQHQYEPHLTRFYEQHVRDGATVVDVGANIGFHTLLAARLVGETGRVIAFEPNSENCRLILLGLHKNGLGNVALYPVGLSDRAGLAFFSTHLGSNGGFLPSAETTLLDPNCVVIPTMRSTTYWPIPR